jgi:hypothetical protein
MNRIKKGEKPEMPEMKMNHIHMPGMKHPE